MDGEGENKSNINAIDPIKRRSAVAVKDQAAIGELPVIKASGRGALAEKILEIAYANDIKVREDKDLAELLAELEEESPIPTESLMAVAEILSYVYRANGQPDPFAAVLTSEDEGK